MSWKNRAKLGAAGAALFLTLGASSCGGDKEEPDLCRHKPQCHAEEQRGPPPDCECYIVGGPDDPTESPPTAEPGPGGAP